MARMSLGQWRAALGPHLALEAVPTELGIPGMQVVRAVNQGRLRIHTFRAADGRVFRAVRQRDLEGYRTRAQTAEPPITLDGMTRAFEEIAAA